MAKKTSSSPGRRSSRQRQTKSAGNGIPAAVKSIGWSVVGLALVIIAYCVATPVKENSSARSATTEASKLQEVKTPAGLTEEILPYTGMTVSFNRNTHEPNYVAWELLGSEVSGESGREPAFLVDASVDGCAVPDDYRLSGFDRGHMAPAGDMKWHPQAMRESFYMTNICPQAPDLNRGAWKKLEEKCRQRAEVDSALIIICGPVFDKNGPSARIGSTGVAVPSSFFKVILAPYAATPWAIGFIMPNGYVAGGMQKAAVTVDEVEALTGYDFFAGLPDEVEEMVESQCDFNSFSNIRKR